MSSQPIGLRPRFILDYSRRLEILEAMKRYADNGKVIPVEWVDELLGIVDREGERKGEK
jgi:hypothetical protein